jgi:ribonuclease VapC
VSVERPRYVLDSFALLAYLAAEPGETQVKAILNEAQSRRAEAYLSIINFGEVIYITEREQGLPAAQKAIAATDQLPIVVIEADRRQTFAAAHLKAHHAISYADAFAAALAEGLAATLLTGDPEFRKVEAHIAIEWLPQPDGATATT